MYPLVLYLIKFQTCLWFRKPIKQFHAWVRTEKFIKFYFLNSIFIIFIIFIIFVIFIIFLEENQENQKKLKTTWFKMNNLLTDHEYNSIVFFL